MRLTLKISGSKCVALDDGPVIKMKPIITTTIPTARRMKLILSKANFCLSAMSISYYN